MAVPEIASARAGLRPLPDVPGWDEWAVDDPEGYNTVVLGRLLVRREEDRARLRLTPTRVHGNLNGVIHGGVILSLIDVALFACCSVLLDKSLATGVTMEVTNQFVGPGDLSRPLDAVVEVVRETGRMIFARGLVVQDDDTVASFSGIVRKPSPKR